MWRIVYILTGLLEHSACACPDVSPMALMSQNSSALLFWSFSLVWGKSRGSEFHSLCLGEVLRVLHLWGIPFLSACSRLGCFPSAHCLYLSALQAHEISLKTSDVGLVLPCEGLLSAVPGVFLSPWLLILWLLSVSAAINWRELTIPWPKAGNLAQNESIFSHSLLKYTLCPLSIFFLSASLLIQMFILVITPHSLCFPESSSFNSSNIFRFNHE